MKDKEILERTLIYLIYLRFSLIKIFNSKGHGVAFGKNQKVKSKRKISNAKFAKKNKVRKENKRLFIC